MVAGIPLTTSSMFLFSPWMKFWLFTVTENIIPTYTQPTARSIQWPPENLLIHTSWSQQIVIFTKIPINLHSCSSLIPNADPKLSTPAEKANGLELSLFCTSSTERWSIVCTVQIWNTIFITILHSVLFKYDHFPQKDYVHLLSRM